MAQKVVEVSKTKADTERNLDSVWTKLQKLVKYFQIEIVILFQNLPGYLNVVALIFLPIDKACRYNLHYSDEVCDNLNNRTLKSACVELPLDNRKYSLNQTTAAMTQSLAHLTFSAPEMAILKDVCTAEVEAQRLQVEIYLYRCWIGYIGLVFIVYAGALGDKYNRKKLYLLLPSLGRLVSVLAYLTTSVFQSQVPMEFHLVVDKITQSLSGGSTLLAMGVYAYLAAETKEENRTFRFGVSAIFQAALGTVANELSGPAFEYLGYVKLFSLSTVIHVLGTIFIVFYIKEIPLEKSEEQPKTGVDNPEFVEYIGSMLQARKSMGIIKVPESLTAEKEMGFWGKAAHIFMSNFEIFKVDRAFGGRKLLILAVSTQGFISLINGEYDIFPLYGRQAWGWTYEFGTYTAFSTAVTFVGSVLLTSVFVKTFKLSDSILVIISFSCMFVSKVIFSCTKTILWIYVAATFSMFANAHTIAGRSLLSKIVEANELGRCYTTVAISEIFLFPVTSIIYSVIYESTIVWFPGTFFLFSAAILLGAILAYLKIEVLYRRFEENSISCSRPFPTT